jgi:hypothetical protein
MPMGPALGGFAYFAGTKFLGYSAFAHVLRKKFNDSGEGPKRTLEIGGVRTLIGVGAGIAYGGLMGLAWEKVSATHEVLGWILYFGGMLRSDSASGICFCGWLLRARFEAILKLCRASRLARLFPTDWMPSALPLPLCCRAVCGFAELGTLRRSFVQLRQLSAFACARKVSKTGNSGQAEALHSEEARFRLIGEAKHVRKAGY